MRPSSKRSARRCGTTNGGGCDVVLLGQQSRRRSTSTPGARLNRKDHAPVVSSLEDINMGSAIRLLATYAGQAADLSQWLAGAEINHDWNLRLQYLAGLWLNVDQEKFIYQRILASRRFPEELFVGQGTHRAGLKWTLERSRTEQ